MPSNTSVTEFLADLEELIKLEVSMSPKPSAKTLREEKAIIRRICLQVFGSALPDNVLDAFIKKIS